MNLTIPVSLDFITREISHASVVGIVGKRELLSGWYVFRSYDSQFRLIVNYEAIRITRMIEGGRVVVTKSTVVIDLLTMSAAACCPPEL